MIGAVGLPQTEFYLAISLRSRRSKVVAASGAGGPEERVNRWRHPYGPAPGATAAPSRVVTSPDARQPNRRILLSHSPASPMKPDPLFLSHMRPGESDQVGA